MGWYINGPAKGKAQHILDNPDAQAVKIIGPSWPPPSGRAFVVVVDNPSMGFEAAGYAFDQGEVLRFSARGDPHERVWIEADEQWVRKETGYKEDHQ